MTDKPYTGKPRGRRPGSVKPKMSPLHENYDSDKVALTLGVEIRADLARRARMAGLTMNQYVIELLQKERVQVALRVETMQRLERNAAGCTVSTYADYLCNETMNQRGEF